MKLWEPIKCCCCFDRRNGSLIIGSLFLIAGCLNVFGAVKAFIVPNTNEIRELCTDEDIIPDCENLFHKISVGISVTGLVLGLLQITFSTLLILGIMKNKSRFLVPMMIMYLVQILVVLILAAIIVGLFMYAQIWVLVIAAIVCFGLAIFIETYFLLVIRAHYFDIKRLKGQIHLSLNEQGTYEVPCADSKVTQY